MSESFIEPESLNSTLVSLDAILDDDGAVRLLNKELSSYNFDGVIPTTASTILVSQLEVGMSFLPIGETEGALRTVVKVEFDDPEMTDTPSTDYIISYLSPSGDIQSVTYDGSQNIEVYFEDWEDKVLGTKGWLITQEGNAIFSNVAVRGRIEATEGLIDGDLIVNGSLSTSETADTEGGIVFDSTGIFAYDPSGNNTFLLDATTGDITIFGTPGDDLLTGEDVSDGGTTIISANRITTGSVTGRVFRSNSTMTPTSGTGIYLDGNNNVRFSDPDATFTFNSSGLNITNGSNATLTFNSTGLSISGAGVTIGGTNPDDFLVPGDVGSSGTTSISGNRITTGVIDSAGYGGVTDGSVFAPGGMAINLDNGTITAKEFRIDTAGNAYFNGELSANSITSGTLNASLITVTNLSADSITTGTLEADFISGGTLDASEITVTNLSANSITTGTFSGDRITGGTITGTLISTGGSNRVTLNDSSSTFGKDSVSFYSGNVQRGIIYWDTFGNELLVGGITRPVRIDPSLKVNGNAEVFGTLYTLSKLTIAQNGLEVQNGGITNLAGQITSLPTYNNDGSLTNNVHITAAGVFRRNSSTQKKKYNIIPISGELSNLVSPEKISNASPEINYKNILNLTPVQFSPIENEEYLNKNILGFIAEDIADKMPEIASYDANNEPEYYDVNGIVAALLAVVKDQVEEINELKNRINSLENIVGIDG